MRRALSLFVLPLLGCEGAEAPPPQYPGSDFEGPAFEFEQVLPDVYQARGTGNVSVGANAAIVINEDDVLIVDSHVSPAAAAALLDELRTITDKPVRYVVNTHFHFDHAHGNQIYGPGVEIIGHEFTHEMLASGGSVSGAYLRLMERMAEQPGFTEGQEGLVPTPPTLTLSERLTLHRGEREIQLLFFGRGHTAGDVVVYLPRERVLMTGDLLIEGLPFMADGFPEDWVATLEELKTLDFDVVVPGHGAPFRDRARIDHLQALISDLWDQAVALHGQGLDASQAADRIDLSSHAAAYPSLTGPGADPGAVERIFGLIDR